MFRYNPHPKPVTEPLFKVSSQDEIPKSLLYAVVCNKKQQTVYHTDSFDYTVVVTEDDSPVQVEITVNRPFEKVVVRPLSAKIETDVQGNQICFTLPRPQKVSVEFDDDLKRPLFLLCSKRIPQPEKVTHLFEKGKIYNVGTLDLCTGDVVYFEEGSIVFGRIRSRMANNVQILGNGILNGSVWHPSDENGGGIMVELVLGRNLLVEGITVVDGGSWHIVPAASQHVTVKNVNVLSRVVTGDGIDIVGCEDVHVQDCFIRACDDCIAIKAASYPDPSANCNVRHVVVEDSVFWNAEPGNALEIGYELRCDDVSDIVFRNCDIIHCEYEGNQSGGVLTIHNADRACVHDIYYEDIRIEDAKEKFIDMKVLDSKYSLDRVRGEIKDIYFKNVEIVGGPFPVSIIRGFEMANEVSRPHDIHFKNVVVHGRKMMSANDMRMVVELARNLYFE